MDVKIMHDEPRIHSLKAEIKLLLDHRSMVMQDQQDQSKHC
jgi:hypothetical protein